MFFLDKGQWLKERHRQLYAHLTNYWGFNIKNIPILSLEHWPEQFMNDWEPTEEAIKLNQQRISKNAKKTMERPPVQRADC